MELTTLLPLLTALIASALAIGWVARPLFSDEPPETVAPDDRLTSLKARKEATLAALRELDFDRRTGKLSDEDFQRYDARLRRQAIILQQQIDQILPSPSEISAAASALDAEFDGQLDADLEAEIARRRKALQPYAATAVEST